MDDQRESMSERSALDLAARHAGARRMAVNGIVGVNLVVFAFWQLAKGHAGLADFMQANFLVSLEAVEQGRIWTLVTSEFSHNQVLHLAINMLVLKSFAPPIARAWGLRSFLTFYLSAAVAASIAHVVFTWFGWPGLPALGASGAIAGLLIAYAFLYPRRMVYLFALVPIPAWFMAVAFVGFDLWGLVGQYRDRYLPLGEGLLIGHGAHLGGALFGAIWSLMDRSRFDDLLTQEQEALDYADQLAQETARERMRTRLRPPQPPGSSRPGRVRPLLRLPWETDEDSPR